MAFFGKTFVYEKDDNFEAFIDSLGISAERAEGFRAYKPSHKLVKDGETYTLYTNDAGVNFKSGVEFDSVAAGGAEPIKTTITVDGNVVTQVQKFNDGRTITFKREYSEDKMVSTITTSFWDGTATRYYTAA